MGTPSACVHLLGPEGGWGGQAVHRKPAQKPPAPPRGRTAGFLPRTRGGTSPSRILFQTLIFDLKFSSKYRRVGGLSPSVFCALCVPLSARRSSGRAAPPRSGTGCGGVWEGGSRGREGDAGGDQPPRVLLESPVPRSSATPRPSGPTVTCPGEPVGDALGDRIRGPLGQVRGLGGQWRPQRRTRAGAQRRHSDTTPTAGALPLPPTPLRRGPLLGEAGHVGQGTRPSCPAEDRVPARPFQGPTLWPASPFPAHLSTPSAVPAPPLGPAPLATRRRGTRGLWPAAWAPAPGSGVTGGPPATPLGAPSGRRGGTRPQEGLL